MKKSDVKIISHLRTNGRMQLTDLSRKTGLPVSTIHERLKHLVEQKLLRPTMLLNFEKTGFASQAYILLGVDQKDKDKLFSFLRSCDHVNSLFRINNGCNILMHCIFKDMHDLENFMESIETTYLIRQKQVHYVLDEVKLEQFFAQPAFAQQLIGDAKV